MKKKDAKNVYQTIDSTSNESQLITFIPGISLLNWFRHPEKNARPRAAPKRINALCNWQNLHCLRRRRRHLAYVNISANLCAV